MKTSALCALGALVGVLLPPAGAQTVIDAPVSVPLHFRTLSSGVQKVGIYVGIGGGAAALFEFDTGAGGLYAAYASANPAASPWWGSSVTTTSTTVQNKYDSGLLYTGFLAEASVSLFESATATTPKVTTASTAQIGQMNNIVDTKHDPETILWTPDGGMGGTPPIDGHFYGDFGMSLAYAENGISNLVAQLPFGPNVTAGFRVHIDPVSQQAHLQIGLTAADTASPTALYFQMNPDPEANGAKTPVGNQPYYDQQLFNADIHIADPKTSTSSTSLNVPITPDTGASTTIHNADNSSIPADYYHVDENGKGKLHEDLEFKLSNETTSGGAVDFFAFETTHEPNNGEVTIQDNNPDSPDFYLNTGISFFFKYDVIYDLEHGVIGLEAVPEPSSLALCGLATAAGAALWMRKRRRAGTAD